ncbi:F-box domain containing protein [Tanacetum coccineum]
MIFALLSLTKLNFDGGEILDKIIEDPTLHDSEWSKYINQVNSVIQSYNHSIIQDFRIRFAPANNHYGVINEWLQFAVNKKVEFLELDLINEDLDIYNDYEYYDLPLSLFLQEFLTNCPHLETIVIHETIVLKHFRVGGRALNLKHIEIGAKYSIESIYLSDFDLVSFTLIGCVSKVRLSHLPKLKEVDICDGYVISDSNVSNHLSSCASSLQVLSISISPIWFDFSSELPSIKELRLEIDLSEDNRLIYLASILNACPNLVTLRLKPIWTCSFISRRNTKDVTNPKEHLKIVKIEEYFGHEGDVELVEYIVHTAVALKKIVIDYFCYYHGLMTASQRNFLENKKAARSNVRLQLASILPQDFNKLSTDFFVKEWVANSRYRRRSFKMASSEEVWLGKPDLYGGYETPDNDDDLINDLKKDEEMEGDSDTEAVPDTIFDDDENASVEKQKTHSEDPFNMYTNSHMNKGEQTTRIQVWKSSLKYPVFYTISDKGGSILQVMEEMVKVGHTIGYNMEGCIKHRRIFKPQGVNDVNDELYVFIIKALPKGSKRLG